MNEGIQTQYTIRWMLVRDRLEIREIHALTGMDPWDSGTFNRELNQNGTMGIVAVDLNKDDRDLVGNILGYLIYRPDDWICSIINMAVHPDDRRSKVGSNLIESLRQLQLASNTTERDIEVVVRERDLASQVFFRHLGFETTGIEYDYWDCPPDAGYVMKQHYADFS